MRGGRILWGQIAVVLTIVFVMMWLATQWAAWRLGFQARLGSPWFELAGWPIYYPPAFFWWWFSFDAYAPAIFTEGGTMPGPASLGTPSWVMNHGRLLATHVPMPMISVCSTKP